MEEVLIDIVKSLKTRSKYWDIVLDRMKQKFPLYAAVMSKKVLQTKHSVLLLKGRHK
jgi:hypothetical protein